MVSVGQKQVGCAGVSRREFLRFGGLGVFGCGITPQVLARQSAAGNGGEPACIFLLLSGGPSQFETFDPKPEAPSGIRGPFRPISTAIPGIQVCETLPRLALRADRYSLLRSMWHDAAPIHETGQQLVQTGRLASGGIEHPSCGSVLAKLAGSRESAPYVVLPRLMQNTGVHASHGQGAGWLGDEFAPAAAGSPAVPAAALQPLSPAELLRYGDSEFGQACCQARRLVELGVRFVTINMYDSLVGSVTWDCHANGRWSPTNLYHYQEQVCPAFDRACAALLDDLLERGLLERTLVVATGEFGRTPRINDFGGRDHWPGVWSGLVAGGGIQGGRVIGASDARGSEPLERPIEPAELVATIYRSLEIDGSQMLDADRPITDGAPLGELFA